MHVSYRKKLLSFDTPTYLLWTPIEGINQRNLKFWADVATKYASAVPIDLGLGFDFRPCSKDNFLTGRP